MFFDMGVIWHLTTFWCVLLHAEIGHFSLIKVRQINANNIFGKLSNKVAALALGQRAQVAMAA